MSSSILSHFLLKTSTQPPPNISSQLPLTFVNSSIIMNSFVVVFAAIILAVNGGSLREGRHGWGVPASPTVLEIGLSANTAAAGSGGAAASIGAAEASQDVIAVATGAGGEAGWPAQPAIIGIAAYADAVLGQEMGITQVASVDLSQPGPTTSTLNLATVDNFGYGDEGLSAYLEGVTTYLGSSASDSASGSGLISASANTVNTQSG
ncbi:unnamed protein product [Orchesella dallaii]|uniref:Uncharacterized protein n=1 Tax=Orchesella dallaii TaxID=48710 RepID=A0ABP1S4C3_9HEXA